MLSSLVFASLLILLLDLYIPTSRIDRSVSRLEFVGGDQT